MNLQAARDQMRFARQITSPFLDGLKESDWFAMPGDVTHLAWQIGHLAVAQYHLVLARVRGKRPEDAEYLPETYFDLFGRGSTPSPVESSYPSVAEIREVFEQVNKLCFDESASFTDEQLAEPTDPPHPAFKNKLGAIWFASRHELIHAGQIALLRRELGYSPLR